MNIEIPDSLAADLAAKAATEGLSASTYIRQVLERNLAQPSESLAKPKKSAYGLLAQYGPGPSAEEIEENRREMFNGFGEELE